MLVKVEKNIKGKTLEYIVELLSSAPGSPRVWNYYGLLKAITNSFQLRKAF